jgi:dihydroorotase
MRPLLLHGGRVIDPASGRDEVADVMIGEDGTIREVAPGLLEQTGRGVERVDARGKWVLPGFVDVHVHFREPGYEYKESIATGSKSAAAGGYTTVACMANTRPVNDTGAVTRFIRDRAAAAGLCRVLPIGALSHGLEGKELAEIGDMVDEGACAVSDDGMPVMDAHLMRRALEYARPLGVPVVAHEEDSCLSQGGCMNEGRVATELGLRGIPNAAEDVMVARDLLLAELTGGRLHIAHLSTEGAVRLVREAKARGVAVTCEATPHHAWLTDEACRGYDPDFKMMPPLRGERDRQAIVDGLADRTIDCIATDHAPHATQDKEVEFALASHGVVGLETAWGLTLRLVQAGRLPLLRAVELLTVGPSGAFGLPYGKLARGASADLCLVDPQAEHRVVAEELFSKSKNTPFSGWVLPGRVERTLLGGKTTFRLERG